VAVHNRAGAARSVGLMQAELLAARTGAGIGQQELARHLGVTPRSLRDWEKAYDVPSTRHFLGWAGRLGRRLTLVESQETPGILPVVRLDDGEAWERHETRRLVAVLRARREERGWTQTDMGLLLGVSRSSVQRWEDVEKSPQAISLAAWAHRLDFRLALVWEKNLAWEFGTGSAAGPAVGPAAGSAGDYRVQD